MYFQLVEHWYVKKHLIIGIVKTIGKIGHLHFYPTFLAHEGQKLMYNKSLLLMALKRL